uniref:Salivary secreted mucin 3 n=1 Tax=Anopheles christyi TaxID=43041 RepID=A0A182KCL5_9DIPT
SYEKEKDSEGVDDAEYIVVPLSHHRPTYYNRYPSSFEGFDGVVDTGDFAPVPASPVYFPTYNPFSWHVSGYLDDLLKRVRDRFAGSWNPFYGGDYLPSGPGIWPVEIPDDSSEDGVTNSTSTVKVIDGHKVVINDTYYTKKTEFGTSIFKVRVIDVKPTDDGSSEEVTSPKAPTDVEVGNRNGGDEESDKEPAAPSTDAPKRDTELESSDEDKTTVDDDNLNTIDTSDVDIDEAKENGKEEAPVDQSEVNTESSTDAAEDAEPTTMDGSPETTVQRNRENSELLESSSEEENVPGSDVNASRHPMSNEWPKPDDRQRIIVSTNRFSANQERPVGDAPGSPAETGHDLTNDIAINFRLAADKSVTANPNAITFNPMNPPTVIVQRDPFPAGPGRFPSIPGRPAMGFPGQQPFGGVGFPSAGPFPGFPGGQFPVQPYPMFGVPTGTNFGLAAPQNPQIPPFFFGNGQFRRP